MKKKIIITIILTLFLTKLIYSQLDCSNFMSNLKAEPPYKKSSLSKSSAVISGINYKYYVPLSAGKEYRLFFFASPAFNNKINFKIIDLNNPKDSTDDQILYDLPGENPATNNALGTAALAPYIDPETNKAIHPYFDIIPEHSTKLEIIIHPLNPPPKKDDYGNTYREIVRGCVAIFVLEKPAERKSNQF